MSPRTPSPTRTSSRARRSLNHCRVLRPAVPTIQVAYGGPYSCLDKLLAVQPLLGGDLVLDYPAERDGARIATVLDLVAPPRPITVVVLATEPRVEAVVLVARYRFVAGKAGLHG